MSTEREISERQNNRKTMSLPDFFLLWGSLAGELVMILKALSEQPLINRHRLLRGATGAKSGLIFFFKL
ncbi:MAG: hypothetical protein C4534_11335 [Gaiellales bacterium]|nr:MAG: hypothetical protein C4534_11335 [Gaiellales bacterium]